MGQHPVSFTALIQDLIALNGVRGQRELGRAGPAPGRSDDDHGHDRCGVDVLGTGSEVVYFALAPDASQAVP